MKIISKARGLLNRTAYRLGLIAFLPFCFVAVLLAAPRMMLDWNLRRDWVEDFVQFFQADAWVEVWEALKKGRV